MRYLYILWAFCIQQEREITASVILGRSSNKMIYSQVKINLAFRKKSEQETLDSLIHPL